MHRARRTLVAALLALLVATPVAADGPDPGTREGEGAPEMLVFGAEGNRLNAYDAETGAKATVIPSAAEGGLDINAQICFRTLDDTTYFVAGEDTGQSGSGGDDPAGSPGWGWFELTGDRLDELGALQHGKLVPTWSGSASNPENYGCGFLHDGRLVTSDVGDQLPHEEASGQLLVWFPTDAEGGFADSTVPGAGLEGIENEVDDHYCKVDTQLGTAGGVWVDDEDGDGASDWIYVATNRPGPDGPGGVYRYPASELPSTEECLGQGRDDDLVDAGLVEKELWLPNDPHVATPSALVPSGRTVAGHPTWYVSSVFTGVVAEYVDTGAARVHLRNVVEPPAGLPVGQAGEIPGNDGGTPFGLGVDPSGDLWYADLGVRGTGPGAGLGSVQRVSIDGSGSVQSREVVDDGLDFPDGIGVLTLPGTVPETDGDWPDVSDPGASSASGCDEWTMYGRSTERTFAVPDACRSRIDASSVSGLAPAWAHETERTVTASPAVASVASADRVFVGDWSGTMYALDAATGEEVWTFGPIEAPGATFGPIVSSAAVAEVRVRVEERGPPERRPLVIFGAGPTVLALDAATGEPVWEHVLDDREDTPVQVESSPVVHRGIVFVGMDNHDTPGTGVRGGLLALDAGTGELLWRFDPERHVHVDGSGHDHGDAGCGGVWSSPTLNLEGHRPLVYVATANCPNDGFEWTPHTEAVTALDARTAEVVWTFQPHLPNDRDHDFGATPNLFRDGSGSLTLGVGNKDGSFYALDPWTGELRWKEQVAEPGDVRDGFSVGGFIGSTAAHRGRVFGATALGGPPYYHALDGASGGVLWRGAQGPSYAASAAVNDVVLAAALDDVLRAYDAETGAVLAAHPLLGPGSSGPAVVGDRVYVGSGTSSSDACAKDTPVVSEACFRLFEDALGATGGVHAFELPAGLPVEAASSPLMRGIRSGG